MSSASPPEAPIVVALGGNAISPAGERDSIGKQFAQTQDTIARLGDLLASGRPVVITHGNGPQVGAACIRNELASERIYALPLDVIVADLQGGMGYMLAQCITEELRTRDASRDVTVVITTVEVDDDDPSFRDPSKPVGPTFDADRASRFDGLGWTFVELPGGGIRRVVPSPRPRAIGEVAAVRRLLEANHVVIACGGGGIPVARDADGRTSGREGVVDKDFCSGLLAEAIDASLLFNITGIDRVRLDYGTDQERPVDRMTVAEARRAHLADGQFPRGSMGPKVEAAAAFVDRARRREARAVITDIAHIGAALEGKAGTEIVRK